MRVIKTIGLFFFFLIATAIALLALQKRTEVRQHASSSQSVYPANIEYENAPYGSYQTSNLTNPTIGAVDINMNWIDVEPQQGVFNWTPMDNEMAAWSQSGKKFTLIVRYIKQNQIAGPCLSTTKEYLPAWEILRIPHFCNAVATIIPNYFDTTFKADLQAYVSAIAQHVAASPYKQNLAYVRIGVGEAGEGYPCLWCSQSDMQQLATWGYTISNWAAWQKEMLTGFHTAFSSLAQVIYPMGFNDIDPATGNPVSQDIGYWAASQGMGIGQQGLVNKPGYANGSAVKIAQYVRAHYPQAYIQFQTVFAVGNEPDIKGDTIIANAAGAFSIEWYASDTINPAFQADFQQWQQQVDARTGGTTSSPSPTPLPSATPTAAISNGVSPTGTATPTPTVGAGDSLLDITMCLHGLGFCGDNVSSGSAPVAPKHPTRTITISLFKPDGTAVGKPVQGPVTFVPSAGNFHATVDLGIVATGNYLLKIVSDGYLEKQLPQVIAITSGKTTTISSLALVTGNINNDGKLDVSDYSALVDCYGAKQTFASCKYPVTTASPGADILDDEGQVDGGDYNEFVRELSVQNGQ